MARKRGTSSPGSVVKKRNKLYIKISNKWYKTGLNADKQGYALAYKLKDEYYRQQITGQFEDATAKQKTIAQAWQEFTDRQIAKGRAQKTMKNYEWAYCKVIEKPDEILSKKILEKMINSFVLNSDMQVVSKNTALRHIRTFVNYCISEEYIKKTNICNEFMKKVQNKPKEPFSDEEMEHIFNFLETMEGTNYRPDREFNNLIRFMYMTGFRISETLNMKFTDINFETGIIEVPNKINKEVIDTFPITKNISELLLEQYQIAQSRYGAKKQKVFKWEAVSKSNLTKKFNNVCKKLGYYVPGESFHRLRNTFSNKLINSGVSLKNTANLMRHTDINLTYRKYTKKYTDVLKDILEEKF